MSWDWVASVRSIDEVSEVCLKKSYGLEAEVNSYCQPIEKFDDDKEAAKLKRTLCFKKCSSIKAGNINCINALGWIDWIDKDESFRRFCANNDLLQSDPLDDTRNNNEASGLTNLGATCYLNSFLQVWFYDLAFRQGVYMLPIVKPVPDIPSPIYELQLLFACLESSKKKVYNPKSLVESMKLNEGEQQDANEFYRLFIGLMERFIQATGAANFLTEMFSGTYAHSTQCQKCKTKSQRSQVFTQIELNIKDKITLDESLRLYLQEEILSGDNQYFCQACNTKQPARRMTELLKLPKTLNFQLMRFYIDFQSDSFTKKKSKALVRFPMVIDMSKYVCDSHQPMVYELRAVLIHKGPSAYSGHYIAHVYDEGHDRWLSCNDENCTPIEETSPRFMFDVSQNDDGERKNKKAKKEEDIADDALFSSRNAYMLIYRLKEEREPKDVSIPEDIAYEVNWMNSELERQIRLFENQRQEVQTRFQELRNERILLLNEARVESDSQESYVIPTAWLKSAVIQPLEKKSELPQLHVNELLCEHGKLSLDKLGLIKRLSMKASPFLKSLYVDVSTLKKIPADCCLDCVQREFLRKSFLLRHSDELDVFLNLLKSESPLSRSVWLSRHWVAEFSKKKPRILQESSKWITYPFQAPYWSHVVCQHGKLSPESTQRRLVPDLAWEFLRENINGFKYALSSSGYPLFDGEQDVCSECLDEKDARLEMHHMRQDQAREERSILKSFLAKERDVNKLLSGSQTSFYLVPIGFITKWRAWVYKTSQNEQPDKIDTSDFICEHSKLACDVNEFNERGILSEKAVVWPWERMHAQDTESSFYFRDKLPFRATEYLIVSEEEWELLTHLYQVEGKPIKLKKRFLIIQDFVKGKSFTYNYLHLDDGSTGLEESFSCWACYAKSRLGHVQFSIHVRSRYTAPDDRVLFQPQPVAVEERGAAIDVVNISSDDDVQVVDSSKRKRPAREVAMLNSAFGMRQSTLTENLSLSRKTRSKVESIVVDKDETVLNVKQRLSELFKCHSINQRLFFAGIELEDNNKTLGELQIPSDALLEVQILRDDRSNSTGKVRTQTDIVDDDMTITEAERGFKGTILA